MERKLKLSLRKNIALLIILPIALGGAWRIFALTEAGIGVFMALLLRDVKKLNGE